VKRNVGLTPSPLLPGSSSLPRTGWTLARRSGIRPVSARREGAGRKTAARRDTGPSRKVRALVLARDGYACVCCGQSVIGRPYSLQHRKRRSQGGGNSASNLVTVLGTGTTLCHERIDSRRDPHDEARGYTVRSWQDPALIPVMIFSEGGSGVTAWLWDDGEYHFDGPQEVAA
jgi:5-methylcytosine-specific restriction endonuclease McrA